MCKLVHVTENILCDFFNLIESEFRYIRRRMLIVSYNCHIAAQSIREAFPALFSLDSDLCYRLPFKTLYKHKIHIVDKTKKILKW